MKFTTPLIILVIGLAASVMIFVIYGSNDGAENSPALAPEQQVNIIDEREILSGGVGKDGIPSIDDPQFVSVSGSHQLTADDMGVSVTFGDTKRFYPYRILVFHEIVNDVVDGRPIAVTYCPLCGTGIVFSRHVNGETLEFGVSGKLWQSNLLMYDRSTDSLWSQVLGQAVVGSMAGVQLDLAPSDIVSFGSFAAAYPRGQVLSEQTGAVRRYGHDPYGSYYNSPRLMFPVRAQDDRLHPKDMVLGVIIEGQPKAYSLNALKREKKIVDTIENVTLEILWNQQTEEAAIFRRNKVGETRVLPFPGFWFSWVAAHPDTQLYN